MSKRGPRLFRPASRERFEVVLNWTGKPDEKLEFYAESFHQAGKALLKAYGDTGTMRDFEACPIVYLYRHALELYLKGFLIAGDSLLHLRGEAVTNRKMVLSTHRLTDLLPDFERILKCVGWNWDFGPHGPNNRSEALAILNEFDNFDQQSHSFRYPMDKKGKPGLPSHFAFDIQQFCQTLDPILDFLHGGIIGINDQYQFECERRAEASEFSCES